MIVIKNPSEKSQEYAWTITLKYISGIHWRDELSFAIFREDSYQQLFVRFHMSFAYFNGKKWRFSEPE